jgi:hypothetical protein
LSLAGSGGSVATGSGDKLVSGEVVELTDSEARAHGYWIGKRARILGRASGGLQQRGLSLTRTVRAHSSSAVTRWAVMLVVTKTIFSLHCGQSAQ